VGSKTPVSGQSFADLFPDVAREWHPTRNGDLTPFDVKGGSNKRVWWRCEQGHEWDVAPVDRRRGERCPQCSSIRGALKRSTPKPSKSLLDLYPEVAADWHPTKNVPLTAADVNPGAKDKRWWQCRTCSWEWETDPDHRTRSNRGCPECARKKLSRVKSKPGPGESLGEKMPHLATEWHPTLNDPLTPFDVRPRGKATVYWRCQFGHVWRAKVAPRAVGIGCPNCSLVGVSEREARLRYELAAVGLPVDHDHPRIAVSGRRPVQADIVIPALRLVVEYDGSYYHATKIRADRDQTAALESADWTVLRIREHPLPSIGGHEVFVTSTESIKSLTCKVLGRLKQMGYPVSELAAYATDAALWAEQAANTAIHKYRARSLASEHPDLARQFDIEANGGIQPDSVSPGTMNVYWWKCDECGYKWRASVNQRLAPRGCKPCGVKRRASARSRPVPGTSFADLFPDVAKEWHPTLNAPLTPDQVAPASNKSVWWQCARGHAWEARIAFRRQYGRCNECPKSESGRQRHREQPAQRRPCRNKCDN
jgi:predicted  nucleic acid-binding Zn-ribbon protein